MKVLLTAALASMFLLASVPAFACDGHKSADTATGDEAVMTSVDDGAKTTDTKAKKKSAKKDAKKEETEQKTDTTDGEV